MTDVPPLLNETMISRMAREVARNLIPLQTIRERYQLTLDDWDGVVSTQIFQQRLAEEASLWNSSDPMNTVKRIGAKAGTMVEESLAELYFLVHDRSQPMAAKVEALKMAARWAGIGDNPNVKGGGDGDRMRITINIGSTKLEFDKERALQPPVIEGELVSLTDKNV